MGFIPVIVNLYGYLHRYGLFLPKDLFFPGIAVLDEGVEHNSSHKNHQTKPFLKPSGGT